MATDPIGSVNVRNSTLAKIHQLRMKMSGDGPMIPLHEVIRIVVEHYLSNFELRISTDLDRAGDGASREIPAHSRQERGK